MAETRHKKQRITAALTAVRIQGQNEASLLRPKLDRNNTFLNPSKIINGNGPAVPHLPAGFCLAFPPAKKASILTVPVKSRSNVVIKGRSARFGEKFGNSPNR